MHRPFSLSCLVVACLVSATAHAAKPEWSSEDLARLTERSIGVLPWHQYVLRSMMRLDQPAMSAELALWGAPGTFLLDEGDEVDGALMRFGIGTNLGVGKPRTGFSVFAGMQADYGLVQQPPVFSSDGTLGGAAEVILYAGASYKGWMATYGTLMGQPFLMAPSLDADPAAFESPPLERSEFVTLYNQEGVAIGGVSARNLTGDKVLAALRAEVAPERLLERLELRKHGLFSTGVARYAEGTNPYADREPSDAPLYEIPLNGDDLGSLGVRASLVPQVAPRLQLRRALVGYVWQTEQIVASGQAGVVTQGGGLVPSVQAQAVFHPEWFKYFSIWGVPRISVSYSWNVPDPIAFFAVEGAHVFGVQYVFGPPEFGRPLVPVYRPLDE